jgi:hypothetical protein
MSKMDNLRAMREARYEAGRARSAHATDQGRESTAATASRRLAAGLAEPRTSATLPESEPTEPLCGHRNMGGRTCTREAGHAAKSHRYA